MSEPGSNPDAARHWDLRAARQRRDIDTLVVGLDDPIEGHFAANYLAELHATQATPQIAKLLSDPAPKKRSAALKALGALGSAQHLPEIERLARADVVPWVRASAVEAAAKLAPIDELRPLLHRGLVDEGWQVRFTAAYVLGLEGSEEDSSVLASAARRDVWWRRRVYRKATRAIRRRTQRE